MGFDEVDGGVCEEGTGKAIARSFFSELPIEKEVLTEVLVWSAMPPI